MWIYLSPHFDDIALSCSGLVWEQTQAGEHVEIWNICAGDPPAGALSAFAQALHDRWQTGAQAARQRRQEDQASCQVMSAHQRNFWLPDCIYRPGGESGLFFYDSEQALFGELHPGETPLVEKLAGAFQELLQPEDQVVCPLSLGGHVDHRLTRLAAELLGRSLWYYADYPYVTSIARPFAALQEAGWKHQIFPVSEAGLAAWWEAIAAHKSQVSTFWPNLEAMHDAIRSYCQSVGGVQLWQAP
jgi:LmbE family N-acetylglucosaminyl deacetylase